MKNLRRSLFLFVIIGAVSALMVRFYFHHKNFYYAGTLDVTKVDITSQISSTLHAVHVQEGDAVTASQTIAELTCEEVKIAKRFAQENYDRYVNLVKSGTATPETLDVMRNRKEDADIRLAWCLMSSPLNGTVLSRYHEPGEWVSMGTKLLTLADTRDVWAYVYVPQTLIAKLSLGMKVQGLLPELNMRAFEGKIIKINEEAEFTPKNVQTREERSRLVFGVKVSFRDSNDEKILKPGMTLELILPE